MTCLFAVSAVGDEHHFVVANDERASRASKPGEPANVVQVEHHQCFGLTALGQLFAHHAIAARDRQRWQG